jgi:hypothetical protein
VTWANYFNNASACFRAASLLQEINVPGQQIDTMVARVRNELTPQTGRLE